MKTTILSPVLTLLCKFLILLVLEKDTFIYSIEQSTKLTSGKSDDCEKRGHISFSAMQRAHICEGNKPSAKLGEELDT